MSLHQKAALYGLFCKVLLGYQCPWIASPVTSSVSGIFVISVILVFEVLPQEEETFTTRYVIDTAACRELGQALSELGNFALVVSSLCLAAREPVILYIFSLAQSPLKAHGAVVCSLLPGIPTSPDALESSVLVEAAPAHCWSAAAETTQAPWVHEFHSPPWPPGLAPPCKRVGQFPLQLFLSSIPPFEEVESWVSHWKLSSISLL